MFAILCRRGLKVSQKFSIFAGQRFSAQENAVFSRSCSSSVCKNVSENETFTVSYLIDSCGMSSNDAISVSNKLHLKSPEKPDAVLELLKEYGFTKAYISKLVIKWPNVLLTKSPNQTLLPKLEFFQSIGVPRPVLAHKLSIYPFILWRSLKGSIIPSYNYLKTLLGSDERVVTVFLRAPMAFERRWTDDMNIFSIMRERGVPESLIVSLVTYQPSLLVIPNEKLITYVDKACFFNMSESTLEHKRDVFRKYGFSESDINAAFLRYPYCMSVSEKKISANMEFLLNEFGCKPVDVARYPVLLTYHLEKRIKPRCLVARVLDEKGMKKMNSASTLLKASEEMFVKSYIVKFEKDVPELMDIYLGKVETHLKWGSVEKF
ncbi:hypothetical protein CASFOL_008949 [Castilleja foliolosa]|uniref:Mitochondrial transcription termination factor n=1 Tax=Castilleja foliolosa TaxID=1961234 RepID=A0ABD3E4I7_9LAMI